MNHISQTTIRSLLIAAGFYFATLASGQAIIRFEPTRSSVNASAFRDYFSQYTLGSIDPTQVSNLLRSRNQFDTMKLVVADVEYAFSLEARDIRSDDFTLIVDSGNGPEPQERTPNVTYSGLTLKGNLPVAITADDHFFTAMISSPEGSIFIESAKKIDPNASDADFVIYNEKSLVKKFKDAMCGADASLKGTPKESQEGGARNSTGCYVVDVAIANDYLMFQKYAYSVANVQLQNLAVLNLVNTNYDNEFTLGLFMKAKIIYVYTSPGNSPWYTGTDAALLLTSFTNWADQNGFGTSHDIGSLWTNRDLDGGTVGLAWVDATCTNAYNILQEFTDSYPLLRVLQAHEMGHNFGYMHDEQPFYIMSPSVNNTNDWSAASIAAIDASLLEANCFATCPPSTPGGRVGIGTATPHESAILDIQSNSKGLLIPRMTTLQRNYMNQPAEGLLVYDTDTKSFWFSTQNTWSEMTDNSVVQSNTNSSVTLGLSGNVGIGVVNPKNKLDIATSERVNPHADPTNLPLYVTGGNPGTTVVEIRDKWAQSGVAISSNGISAVGWTNNNSLSFSAQATTGVLRFNTNTAERMVINSAGNIGIGTSSPNAPLQFANTIVNRKLVLYDEFNNDHQYFGLGINANAMRYQVNGGAASHVFYAGMDGTTSQELFRITGSGKIGVRNSDPQNQMDIVHGTSRTGTHPTSRPFYVTGDQTNAGNGPEIRSFDGLQGIGFGKNTVYATGSNADQDLGLAARGNAGNLVFTTDSTERARITGNGNMAIGTNAPNESAILDVTSTSKGILIPRMSTSERNMIASPPNGLLVFDNTTNSFWYRVTGSWVELADNLDAEVFRNGPDKIYMALTDSVGIGTNNPTTKLDINTGINQYGMSHSNGSVRLSTWIGAGGEIGTVSNHSFSLYANNGVDQFILQPNGNIGMGLSAATHKLDIANAARTGTHASAGRPMYITGTLGDASNGVEIRDNDGAQGIGFGRNTIYAAGSSVDQHIGLASKGSNGNVLFHTNGAERMRIAGNGKIGVNNSAPQNHFDVAPTARTGVHPTGLSMYVTEPGGIGSSIAEFRNTSASCGVGIYNLGITAVGSGTTDLNISSQGTGKLNFKTNNTDRMVINGSGNIGIGTSFPNAPLQFANTTANRKVVLYEDANNEHQYYGFGVNPSTFRYQLANTFSSHVFYAGIDNANSLELFRITGTGKIGVNISDPDYLFSVVNKFGVDGVGAIHVKNTARVMYFMEDFAANRMILSHSPAYPTWGLQYLGTSNEFRFLGDSISAMTVSLGSGNVSIRGTIETESFIAPTLQNNFSIYGAGYSTPGYMKDKMGMVHLRGLVSNTGNPSGLVVFTLPPGYRPSGTLVFSTISNNALARVDVHTNGNVMVSIGAAAWTSLDGIIFKAEQ